MTKTIQFVYPKNTPPVSITGSGCALDCKHCNKHYIDTMPTLEDKIPENAKSLLISGGLDKDGRSYITRRAPELKALKEKGNYKFNSHVGFVTDSEIDELAEIVDYISFDFVSNSDVIKKVYKLDKKVDEYIELYKRLSEKIETYPHITIGLDEGKIHWEYEAIDIINSLGADRLVLNVFIPTANTEFANVQAPNFEELRKVFEYARKVFENKLLIVGCMRPKGKYRLDMDQMAIEVGVDRIVQPTPLARALAKKKDMNITYHYECCAMDS